MDTSERLHKLLASLGVASRRQAEMWIRAGRVTVNGKAATLGQRVAARDQIAVDGRRVRIAAERAPENLVLVYHRPTGEPLSAKGEAAAGGDGSDGSYARLPGVRGRRWLPLSPLSVQDSGLELFTTDGALRAQAGRRTAELSQGYSLRVRPALAPELLGALAPAAQRAQPPFEILSVAPAGGEGQNAWLQFDVRGARGRDLRTLLETHGCEVSRVLRTRFGPVSMDRALARGRHRELEPEERASLYAALGYEPARSQPAPARPRKPRTRTRTRAGR